jgi:hypothetical protein
MQFAPPGSIGGKLTLPLLTIVLPSQELRTVLTDPPAILQHAALHPNRSRADEPRVPVICLQRRLDRLAQESVFALPPSLHMDVGQKLR